MLHQQWVIIHLQTTFFTEFGKPINHLLTGLHVDIVLRGKKQTPRCPTGHPVRSHFLELEAQLEANAGGALCAHGVKLVMDLRATPDTKQYFQKQLDDVGQKVLAVVAKGKTFQLPFFDELRVFDPMLNDLQSYPHLLSTELQKLLHTSGEWQIFWKQKVVDSGEADPLQWWENASLFIGLQLPRGQMICS